MKGKLTCMERGSINKLIYVLFQANILSLFLVVIIFGGWVMAKSPKDINQIDYSDGISKEESLVIAKKYILSKGMDFLDANRMKFIEDSSGFVANPKLYDENWVISVSTTIGTRLRSGLEWGTVYVNKITGEVRYGGEGPS